MILLARSRFSGCLMLVAQPPVVWMGCRTGTYVLRHPSYPPLWLTFSTCHSVFRMFHLSGGSVSSHLFLRFLHHHLAPISDLSQSHPYCPRILEKVVVRSFLYPVLIHKDTQHLFMDQFAFRPTGSTTAAIICIASLKCYWQTPLCTS